MSSKAASSKQNRILSTSKINLPGEAMSGAMVDGTSPEQGDLNGGPKRGVSWQDFHGKELTQVREFEPR